MDHLEKKVSEERAKTLQNVNKSKNGDANENFLIIPQFAMSHRFVLRKELACYILCIENSVPIDYVLLQVKLIFKTIG